MLLCPVTLKATRVAVIDVGSNSGRVVVFDVKPDGVLEVLSDERAPLRLIGDIDGEFVLQPRTQERSLRALRDFVTVAKGAGAKRIIAVGTAAVREAANGQEFLKRIREEAGVSLRVLDSEAEARCAFLGAVHGLPVENGAVLDVGGGSLQLAYFRNRKMTGYRGLPLGALRMSVQYLKHDPPTRSDVRALRSHVFDLLADARIPPLGSTQMMVGTGGTIRNLAKVDARARLYPVHGVHGYELSRQRLRELISSLLEKKRSSRNSISGLSRNRSDSIVGGSLVVDCVMERCQATRLLVAGPGLREGVLYEASGAPLLPAAVVRDRSIRSLVTRFSSWDETRAMRRRDLARALHEKLEPAAPPMLAELLAHAATALDIGRSIDYFRRHLQTSAILRGTVLMGFGHREALILSTIAALSGDYRWEPERYRPLLHERDHAPIEHAGIILAIADEIEKRLAPGAKPKLKLRMTSSSFTITSASIADWESAEVGQRFQRAYDRKLVIRG